MSIDNRKEHIVQQILLSAQRQFQQYGLNKTTMNDIARSAGKGKSTLYHYFKSKEEIFNDVIIMEMDGLFDSIKNQVNSHTDCREQITAYLTSKVGLLREKKNLFKFILERELTGHLLDTHFTVLTNRYDAKERAILKSILENGMIQGQFQLNETQLNLLSELWVSCLRGVEYDILINNKYPDLENSIDFLTDIMIKGLS